MILTHITANPGWYDLPELIQATSLPAATVLTEIGDLLRKGLVREEGDGWVGVLKIKERKLFE
jgi:DNA-binding IclR family transcriptional regulator